MASLNHGFKPNLIFIYAGMPYWNQAKRFVSSYKQAPPGAVHSTTIVLNGCNADSHVITTFKQTLPECRFARHNDVGWDIGAYLALAKGMVGDSCILCCGGHTHFRKMGWLSRLVEAWSRHGPGLYGTLATYEIRPHFCTTGFMCPASLLQSYVHPVRNKDERYEFEHGDKWIVGHAIHQRLAVRLVTWDGEWEMHDWRTPRNIYARGDQSNCLTYFNHSDSYERSDEKEKLRRRKLADTLTVPLLYENRENVPISNWDI